MNKKDFLEELNRYLLILEDEEQQDILEEYSQHIDMKVESGLSEEEAIQDFGSMKELAAQILEAYHVKAEFSGTPKKERNSIPRKTISFHGSDFRSKLSRFFKKVFAALHSGTVRCIDIGKAIGRKIAALIQWPVKRLRPLFHQDREQAESAFGKEFDREQRRREPKRVRSNSPGRVMPAIRSLGRSIASFTGSCIYGVMRLCLWGIRLCWNLFMILLVLSGGFLAMGSLFCFGVLLVWLFKGYPFTGLTILMLGTVLCSGAFMCFCASLIRRSKRVPRETEETFTELTGEVQDA